MPKNQCVAKIQKSLLVIVVVGITIGLLSSVVEIVDSLMFTRNSIKMAFVLFRHGEKNPTSFYPTDPYQVDLARFNGGLGALTQTGRRQAYDLGKNMRKRYFSILPENDIYSQLDINVVSSYAERCIMSAQCLLAGLLPVSTSESNLPIPWQPVPVTSIPRLSDNLIAQRKPCRKYDAMLKDIFANPPPDLKLLNEANDALYEELSLYTGKNISSVLDVEILYNTLKAELDMGLQLPSWTKGIFPESLLPLAMRSYTVFTNNDFMKVSKGGVFLQEVQKKMSEKAAGQLTPNRRLFIYAGHDVTLINVMNSMGILNQTSYLPDYASALVFELHRYDNNKDFEVQIMYYKNSSESPFIINIPNCHEPCSLKEFKKSIAHLMTNDWDKLCENPKMEC